MQIFCASKAPSKPMFHLYIHSLASALSSSSQRENSCTICLRWCTNPHRELSGQLENDSALCLWMLVCIDTRRSQQNCRTTINKFQNSHAPDNKRDANTCIESLKLREMEQTRKMSWIRSSFKHPHSSLDQAACGWAQPLQPLGSRHYLSLFLQTQPAAKVLGANRDQTIRRHWIKIPCSVTGSQSGYACHPSEPSGIQPNRVSKPKCLCFHNLLLSFFPICYHVGVLQTLQSLQSLRAPAIVVSLPKDHLTGWTATWWWCTWPCHSMHWTKSLDATTFSLLQLPLLA